MIARSQYHDGSNTRSLPIFKFFVVLPKRVPMKCKSGFALALFILAFWLNSETFGQSPASRTRNSTEKIRVKPSVQAAKVGSAIKWLRSFEKARKQSVATGKPIFWYVPTVEQSFMDRKVEIDRYMRAGMFSWPKIIDQLNEEFIPLMAVPQQAQALDFDLVPFKFVEPGFLVIYPAGKATLRCDRLTTQHPKWLRSLLTSCLQNINGQKLQSDTVNNSPLNLAWTLFAQGQYRQSMAYLKLMEPGGQFAQAPSAELELLRGMCQFRQGDHVTAKQTWQQSAQQHWSDPLAWKAAAEAEGLGPFVRGFEVHQQLPATAFDKINFSSVTSYAPAATYNAEELWQRSTQFLLGMQRSDGGFVDCDYDFGGTDSLPNVHVAITAICGMALLESKARNVKVANRDQHNAAKLARAFVLDQANWNFNDSDELFWAHAFRVRFLAASIKRGWKGTAQLQAAVQGLESMQLPSGSWYHEYPNPLVTSLALISLKEAEAAGATVNRPIIEKAVASLQRNRGRGGFYYLDEAETPPQAKAKDLTDASAGRLPLCELALQQWGSSNDSQLTKAIRVSFERQSHLFAALKYDDHTSRHAYGGFFFWFDMHGRSEAIRNLTNATAKTKYRARLRDLIVALPEIDGCFVDSHEIGRCYGTAMALLTLAKTEENR